jgi:hypothetical protein
MDEVLWALGKDSLDIWDNVQRRGYGFATFSATRNDDLCPIARTPIWQRVVLVVLVQVLTWTPE